MGKLTARGVASCANRKGRYGDGEGLYLRTLEPGKRVYWVYRYTIAGVEREKGIGVYPAMSLAEARAKHADLRALVLKGIDPLGGRRGAKGAPPLSGKPTFGSMAVAYVGAHEFSWRSSKHARQWISTLRTYCASIWDMSVDAITTEHVLAVLKPIWSTVPETASRVRARIETVIDAARSLGHIPEDRPNPSRWKGHLQNLLPNPRKVGPARGHHAAMAYTEVPEFMAKLAAIDSDAARALMITILCVTRTGETLGSTWDEISFEAATWVIPAPRMKMQKEHAIPLSEPALAILRTQLEARGTNPFIFPGRPMRPLSSMSMSALIKRMGVKGATVHGFRSSTRSWMADQGVAFDLAEQVLAHTVGNAVVQSYQRSSMLERRRPIMSAWAEYVCATGSNVVPLRRA